MSRLICLALVGVLALTSLAAERKASPYQKTVLADDPVAYWRMNEGEASTLSNIATGDNTLSGEINGAVQMSQPGPRPEYLPDFESGNTAAGFDGKGSFVRIKDPGPESSLDFGLGDTITLEAWVNLKDIQNGQNMYVIGKGRTNNKDVQPNNQNYALRLRGVDNSARISFVFREASAPPSADAKADEKHWHRWTGSSGFAERSGWHHIAVTYTFGKSDSIRGYQDGVETKGAWDMGGASNAAPVVDDDEIWIGSSMGGNTLSSFNGLIDEIALYRVALTPEQLKKRFRPNTGASKHGDPDGSNDDGVAAKPEPAEAQPPVETKALIPLPADLPADAVRIEVLEGFTKVDTEALPKAKVTAVYNQPAFAFVTFPKKYNERGVHVDRSSPFALRAAAQITLPPGDLKLLLRARNATRLLLDGQVLATTQAQKGDTSGHGKVPPPPVPVFPGARLPKPGHADKIVTVNGDGKPHVLVLEAFVGGGKLRPEIGEVTLSLAGTDGVFKVIGPKLELPLTDEALEAHFEAQRTAVAAANTRNRQNAGAKEAEYWNMRHELARKQYPQHQSKGAAEIDRLLGTADARSAADDWTFLRRLSLDTTGVVPSAELIASFMEDKSPERRTKVIDRLLSDAGWADHWVAYWQDVLAENPGLLKPELNNTGPFRWWLHEALLDNKPLDRFATELIAMDGSKYGGGPAGFSMATQNDSPMSEKAATLSKAFLAMEMKCARCHDAPHHRFLQKDLFSVAAMLKRAPMDVPKTSSIQRSPAEMAELAVNVTLKPGTAVPAAWPEDLVKGLSAKDIAPGVLRAPEDSREQFAALVTHPKNERFAQVAVNRVWKRLFGWGLAEPVDDWEKAKPVNPELLDYLARELVTHGYDLKHVARLIFNSQAYQRAADTSKTEPGKRQAPVKRRLSAEQIVDSLFACVGKRFNAEELTFDVDGRQNVDAFLNFGVPRRAWEFTSMANERDRPALALPVASTITDVLSRFGWRESRQAPLTEREDAPTVLQPAILANGTVVTTRIARLSDDSAITELCLAEQPLDGLITRIYQRVLCRPPSTQELATYKTLLSDGYEQRVVKGAALTKTVIAANLQQVSWSNHLNPDATRMKIELEKIARDGDPPTQRLNAAWRERVEDMFWALVNSPEFLFMP